MSDWTLSGIIFAGFGIFWTVWWRLDTKYANILDDAPNSCLKVAVISHIFLTVGCLGIGVLA